MSTSYFNNNRYSILLPWDKDRLREWLNQAFELLDHDAVQSQNESAMSMVRGAWRDAQALTNDSSDGDVLTAANTYARFVAYALTHPTPTGRVHAAPLLMEAVPYFVTSTNATASTAPSTLAQWEAVARDAARIYPPGDNLRTAIDGWLAEFRSHGDGVLDRAALLLDTPALAARTVRLGRLYREAVARVRADATAQEVHAPPAPAPAGDTTHATPEAASSDPGAGAIVLAFALAYLLSKRKR